MPATLDDVAAIALALPGVAEADRRGFRIWVVEGKRTFAWERPFSKADVKRFGDEPVPPAPILAVRVADESDKEALIATHPRALFTIPHFDGFAAVLVQLHLVSKTVLRDVLTDGWRCMGGQGGPAT